MTVAVACNLSEGVILGVDSAATVPTPQGAKVFESAEKLFQLGELSVGVAVYGLGAIGPRTLGSYLREFEVRNPNDVVTKPESMAALVEELRAFFMNAYDSIVVPALEEASGKKIAEIPLEKLPATGLVVGGFAGKDNYLSEVWNVVVPQHRSPKSAECCRHQGEFGTNWFAMCDPIFRYLKGFDGRLLNEVVDYLVGVRGGGPVTNEEADNIRNIVEKYEYQIPFNGMPLGEGIEHTRFLAELVVNHHRYAVGDRSVGGRVRLGKVTYRGEKFELLDGATDRNEGVR